MITNETILVPVSIYDVRRSLGEKHDDVGSLCRSDAINKWATFKPHPNGNVATILHDDSAPFGLRTIYTRINPTTGEIIATGASNTTLQAAINALDMALIGGTTNPFLHDLTMYVKPSGGVSNRLTDFVSTEGINTQQQRGNANVHGYLQNAKLQYGYYDQQGHYYGISRGINVDSDGYIAADDVQDIDVALTDMMGNPFLNLDTRLQWGRAIDNNLCVLDWMERMFSLSSKTAVHRGVVLWTNEGSEYNYYVAVHHIPWTGAKGQTIMGLGSLNWNCVEFLTTADVDTPTDFMQLSDWAYNSDKSHWMFIPGMIWKGMHIGNSNPYNVGAYFIRAEVSPFSNVFNLQMRITDLGSNSTVKVFLSDNPNPSSPVDFLTGQTVYEAATTGDHYIYGPANSGISMYPSDYDPSATQIINRFNQVFTVNNTYYLHVWGKRNPSDSSAAVIWTQPLKATVSDSLEMLQ